MVKTFSVLVTDLTNYLFGVDFELSKQVVDGRLTWAGDTFTSYTVIHYNHGRTERLETPCNSFPSHQLYNVLAQGSFFPLADGSRAVHWE